MKDSYYDYDGWRQTDKQNYIFGNGILEDDLSEDVSEIVYRTDVFECVYAAVIDRYIDIEYSFGDYYEVHEDSPLFPFICALCNLSLEQEEEEREKVLWKSTR